jgi:hypothetical protein
MKVGTPFGEFPFEFRRFERRGGGVAIVGIVAGLESSVVVDHDDLTAVVVKLGPPVLAPLSSPPVQRFFASAIAFLRPMNGARTSSSTGGRISASSSPWSASTLAISIEASDPAIVSFATAVAAL